MNLTESATDLLSISIIELVGRISENYSEELREQMKGNDDE